MDSSIVESILKERYYREDETSWDDIALRVANFIGDNDNERDAFYDVIQRKELIPASPFLMNAGTKDPQLFSCFVLPVEDDIGSIFKFYSDAAKVFKSSGGVGANWSALRPKGAPLSGGGETSGVVSFLKIFNEVIETVRQGGLKKGAAICCLNIDHPEIEDFIRMKLDKNACNNFNISPCVTDEFMQKVIHGDSEALRLYNLIVDCAWNSSEPGLLFIDTANNDASVPGLGKYKSPNPCSERFLLDFESCCLSGINWSAFVDNDGNVNWSDFEYVIRVGIRFLDNAIDKNKYPLDEIRKATQFTRRIGLYPIGIADVLIKAGLPYNSQDGRDLCESMWQFMNEIAWDESINIGKVKGTFGAYAHRDVSKVPDRARNAAVTCCAPSGTTSIIAGVNFGIEPFFSFVSTRSQGSGKGFMVNELFMEMLKKYVKNDHTISEIVDECHRTGSIQHIRSVPESIRKIFVSTNDITWKDHIDMQAVFQKHCIDGSISKTINMPSTVTRSDVFDAYMYAWKSGCKGITIYRDGTRDAVYTLKDTSKVEPVENVTIEIDNPVKYKLVTGNGRILPKTPRTMNATVNKRRTACGKLYVIPAEAYDDLHSMFLINKGGGCDAMTQALAELIGAMLRWKIPRWEITRICSSIICPACRNKRDQVDGKSCADIIAQVVLDLYPEVEMPPKKDGEKVVSNTLPTTAQTKIVCPECGEAIVFASGCRSCPSCGWSRCD